MNVDPATHHGWLDWQTRRVADRLSAVRHLRHDLAAHSDEWAQLIAPSQQRSVAESLGAEVWPMADACAFLESHATGILAPRVTPGGWWRDWLTGLRVRVQAAPRGTVLVVGAGNYPLLLAAAPALQALVAGNRVLLKPPPGGTAVCQRFRAVLEVGGLPSDVCQVLNETPAAVDDALASDVQHVVFTGSSHVGRQIERKASERGATCTLELSGCDAVVVLSGADLTRVAQCLAFGLDFNASATCIAPRRVYATGVVLDQLVPKLIDTLRVCHAKRAYHGAADRAQASVQQALTQGAVLVHPRERDATDRWSCVVLRTRDPRAAILDDDLFAAVVTLVETPSEEAAINAANDSRWGLGAAVFGPLPAAEQVAARIEAGCVTVNDLIAPTADPRVPFGGWNESGYGVTRGREGLLAMTRPRTVVTRTGWWLPHLDRDERGLTDLAAGLIATLHGGSLGQKWRGIQRLVRGIRQKTVLPQPNSEIVSDAN